MDIMCRLRKSYPCRHQDEDDPRTKTTDTCVDSQSMCLCEYEDKKEAAYEIERLRNMVEAHHTQWLNAQQMIEVRDDEIKRLREALEKIMTHEADYDPSDCIEIAHAALREKE